MAWLWDLVQLSTEMPLQLPVSTTLLKHSHNHVSHNNPQHLKLHAWVWSGQLLCGSGSENCCPSKSIHKDHLQVKVGPIWEMVQRKFGWFLDSLCKTSFMYLYQDLNRRPTTIDAYRTAIVDTLDPVGLHISQSSDLNGLLSSFHRDCPKNFRNLS